MFVTCNIQQLCRYCCPFTSVHTYVHNGVCRGYSSSISLAFVVKSPLGESTLSSKCLNTCAPACICARKPSNSDPALAPLHPTAVVASEDVTLDTVRPDLSHELCPPQCSHHGSPACLGGPQCCSSLSPLDFCSALHSLSPDFKVTSPALSTTPTACIKTSPIASTITTKIFF